MMLLERGSTIEVQAPAKINLHLEVLGKRPDGFHEIETLIAPISRFDSLSFTPSDAPQIELTCQWISALPQLELPPQESNLVYRALMALREFANVQLGGKVQLIKRIPMEAGMGGASADAAAALLAANRGWELDLSPNQLGDIGAELGSDIPFFLQADRLRPAVCRGRGEHIEPLEQFPELAIVALKPPTGLSTADVYRACRSAENPHRVDKLTQQTTALGVGRELFNRLQEPAFELRPELVEYVSLLKKAGCDAVQMTGSGTALFGVCRSIKQSQRIASLLRSRTTATVFSASTFPGFVSRKASPTAHAV